MSVQNDKIVRGRKAHECDLCGLRIRRGATHWNLRGIGQDGPYDMRSHLVCYATIAKWPWQDQADWWLSPWDYQREFRHDVLGLPRRHAVAER